MTVSAEAPAVEVGLRIVVVFEGGWAGREGAMGREAGLRILQVVGFKSGRE